jgi:hypothetical protein
VRIGQDLADFISVANAGQLKEVWEKYFKETDRM